MSEIKLSQILFGVRQTDIEVCPGQKANSYCPPTTSRSPKRGSSASRSSLPRYSRVALDMKYVLCGNVSALWSKDGSRVYLEIDTGTTGIETYLYDGAKSVCYSKQTLHSSLPFLLYAMHPNNVKFEYTRLAAEQMVNSMNKAAKVVTPTDLGFLCDCVYYDLVDALSARNTTIDNLPLEETELQAMEQCARTGNAEQVTNPFTEFISSSFKDISYTPQESSTKKSGFQSLKAFFSDAKAGEFVLSHEWDSDQEGRIRPLESLEDFIPNNSYKKMVKVAYTKLSRVIDRMNTGKEGLDAIKGDYINIIVGGRPGTGKTTTADALSATLGLPIYTAKVTRNTEEDSFEGMTKVDGDGKFTVHDTAFSKAFETGGIVVLEEFNLADPGVLQGAIGQAIEYPFILNKDGWMEVRRHPLCVIIATMNSGTQGAREPNQALTSRFPITLTMDDPSKEEFVEILHKHGHKKVLCQKVYKAYTTILNYLQNTANDEEMMLCVTMRHCLAALDLVDDGIVDTVRDAIYDTMIGAIALRDSDLADNVFKEAVMPLGGID